MRGNYKAYHLTLLINTQPPLDSLNQMILITDKTKYLFSEEGMILVGLFCSRCRVRDLRGNNRRSWNQRTVVGSWNIVQRRCPRLEELFVVGRGSSLIQVWCPGRLKIFKDPGVNGRWMGLEMGQRGIKALKIAVGERGGRIRIKIIQHHNCPHTYIYKRSLWCARYWAPFHPMRNPLSRSA